MKIVIVDDIQENIDAIASMCAAEGYAHESYTSVESATSALRGRQDLFLVILDHNFPGGADGYSLAQVIRIEHPFGQILPIVYLTGYESETSFLAQQAQQPHLHPTAFVKRTHMHTLPSVVRAVLASFAAQRTLAEQQGAERALLGLAETDPELLSADGAEGER